MFDSQYLKKHYSFIKLLFSAILLCCVLLSVKTTANAATNANKEACKQLVSNMLYNCDTSTQSIAKYKITTREFNQITDSLKYGDCRIIWYSYYSNMYFNYTVKSGYVNEINIVNADAKVLTRYPNVKKNVEAIMAGIEPDMTDLDKVIYIHNCIDEIVNYAYMAYQSYGVGGALGEGKAVCSGYTKTLNMLLDMVGIEAAYVPSKSLNHAWTKVKIDGQWYHADSTWDDTRSAIKGQTGHQYLLCNDDEFSGWKSHVDWTDPDGDTQLSTSTRFSNWFLHDYTGPMTFEAGYWFFVDNNTNDIIKTKATGDDMQVVLYGTDLSPITITGVTKDTVTYSCGGKAYSTPNKEAEPVEEDDSVVEEGTPGISEEETPEEPAPGEETAPEEDPVSEEEPTPETLIPSESSLTNWNDYSLWEMGKYDEASKSITSSITRLHLASNYQVERLATYQAIVPDDDLIMLVYELDSVGNTIITHRLYNGTEFTTANNCTSLSIELMCQINEWNYSSKKFKALITEDTNVGLALVSSNATSPLKETVSLADYSDWCMGQFASASGRFAISKTRMCMKDYIVADPDISYDVFLNQDKYKLLIVQLTDTYEYISSATVGNGESFVSAPRCKFLAITLYSPSLEWTLSSTTYATLFNDGLSVGIISPVKEDIMSTEKDLSNENSENIRTSWDDLSLWQSGQFDSSTASIKTSKTRMILNEPMPVSSNSEYTIDVSLPDLGLIIYELDSAGNVIISHSLKDMQCFTTASNCSSLSVELYCHENEWKYAYKNYKAMFDASNISLGITRTDSLKNTLSKQIVWTNLSSWRSGQYKTESGLYAIGAKTRACLYDYLVIKPNAEYNVALTNEKYQLHIVQMDSEYHFIGDCVVANGQSFTAYPNSKYVGITLYSPSLEWTLNYNSYSALFSEGFSITVTPATATSTPEEVIPDVESVTEVNEDVSQTSEVGEDDNSATEDPSSNDIPDEVPILPEPESISIDNRSWNNLTDWRVGEYSNSTGEFFNLDYRMCLNDYIIPCTSSYYTVTLSDSSYGLLVYQLNSDKTIITMSEVSNGSELYIEADCAYLAVTLYHKELDILATTVEFEELFASAPQIGISRVLNIDDTDVPAAAAIPTDESNGNMYIVYLSIAIVIICAALIFYTFRRKKIILK